ncbi:probable prohibitin [Cyanidioschyzon merolae strain 10D]|jgi:prohibitin 1|uniref:Prohibitin n=1 Tax=Cyanidioschyzon merolae (strain NIES-3377 / 10D) TaxID=280699 RepID=M1V582_CYAM1|nr:probable prohibitin [Cyanidioschyzon merolae strain 10D]BAM80215.1 probable prohibitin [Cyanidioschyzon merolae strain 10D]|eukprot:XP_005534822.1 probable prohibitin [Cyanidioschyzon merolae strain 10D]
MGASGREAAAKLAKTLNTAAKYSIALGVLGSLLQTSLYTVEGGHRAVIFNRFTGVEQRVVGEGTHLRIPWVQKPIIYDVRTRPRTITSVTGTKDLQMVNLTLRVLSKPDKQQLPRIYSRLGVDYDERVLPSIGNEVLKAIVAQYNAEQLLTQREKVSRQIRETLTARAKSFDIELDDVSMTHLTFGREFAQAIEQKQVAQQEAERSRYIVAIAEQERQAAITRAEGESEAAALVSQALQESGAGFIQLRRIEAAREIAETLSKAPNVVYLPATHGTNILLNPGI